MRTNRLAFLACIALLTVAIAIYWAFGIDHGGLRDPEDSAALDSVRKVSLSDIRKSGRVSASFVKRVDVDLSTFTADERKQAFFRMVIPLVARENDRVRAERKSVTADPVSVPDAVYKRYRVTLGNIEELRQRVDVIPASLVLAQAALESGWGTSRFALEGNNLFGMRTYDEDVPGLTPAAAKGFKVMQFDSLGDGVATYVLNLNTHPAYKNLRQARADMRKAGKSINGPELAAQLANYSEIPEKYGRILRALIEREKLMPFDHVRLVESD